MLWVLDAAQQLYEETFLLRAALVEAHVATVIKTALVGFPCFGVKPQVTVDIQLVSFSSLNTQCLPPTFRDIIAGWL